MREITTVEGIDIERGSNNPYLDLNYPAASEMAFKACLVHELTELIKGRCLTQRRAAALLQMSQKKLSTMLRGKFRDVSPFKLIRCLNRLGCDVDIVVRRDSMRTTGRTRVVAA